MISLFFKSLLFSILVPGTVAFFLPYFITQDKQIVDTWLFLPSLILMVFGIAVYVWCAWDFVRYGKGTPAPIDAPKHLVVRGLYHYTRNPMYLGVLCIIFSWALLYYEVKILSYSLLVAVCFQLFITKYEEPKLQQLFGLEYDGYKRLVNRWFPKFKC